ncbi:acyl-CoA dehydrogenase family protein [Pseudonocardia sp. NPDC049154]|uniref:acyl-CoA dehydrogenase family protein n=1 Tax=Pseudonocardia sp. NPDC049154 TaxID=3155501 RepID=UPI0033EB9366
MYRPLFEQDHEDFRALARSFLEKEFAPHADEWTAAGLVPKEAYRRAGEQGLLGTAVPTEYGGGGVDDFRFPYVLMEEAAKLGAPLGGIPVHLFVTTPYYLRLCTPEQAARWLPGIASGETMTSIAMSEPGTGSDLAGIRTTAVRDGDHYVLNGAKTFITGGINAGLVIVAARTSTDPDNRRAGLTLIVVEDGTPGFTRGRKLEKLGVRATDTAELFFDDVRVPVANRLGEEGRAFEYLTSNLGVERLQIAVNAVVQARAAIDRTIDYVRQREVFGGSLSRFQNTKFMLAESETEFEAAQVLLDRAVEELLAGRLEAADAAKVKLFCTEAQGRIVDRCVQLHGGYGYMLEYEITRLYADARVTRIYGGSSEVMKLIIAKSLAL